MMCWVAPFALHAADHAERMRSIVQRMNRPLSSLYYVLVAVGIAVVVVAWIAITKWYRQRCVPTLIFSDKGLLDELTAAHSLTDDQRRLLTDLAGAVELPVPTGLFVSPSRFNEASASLLEHAGADDEVLHQRLQALHTRLFGDPVGC